jgi:hypothetical protein
VQRVCEEGHSRTAACCRLDSIASGNDSLRLLRLLYKYFDGSCSVTEILHLHRDMDMNEPQPGAADRSPRRLTRQEILKVLKDYSTYLVEVWHE